MKFEDFFQKFKLDVVGYCSLTLMLLWQPLFDRQSFSENGKSPFKMKKNYFPSRFFHDFSSYKFYFFGFDYLSFDFGVFLAKMAA